MKLILIYDKLTTPDDGGGISIEYPITLEEMDKRVNEIMSLGWVECEILMAGCISTEYKYEGVEKFKTYKRKD